MNTVLVFEDNSESCIEDRLRYLKRKGFYTPRVYGNNIFVVDSNKRTVSIDYCLGVENPEDKFIIIPISKLYLFKVKLVDIIHKGARPLYADLTQQMFNNNSEK